jgi:hypothetical protein
MSTICNSVYTVVSALFLNTKGGAIYSIHPSNASMDNHNYNAISSLKLS